MFVTSGPDTGMVEYSIGGADLKKVDQFTQWSSLLHLPWLILPDDQLQEGNHVIMLRIAEDKNPKSSGHVCSMYQFVVNN